MGQTIINEGSVSVLCFYVSDFCQVELRLLAHLSSDPELLRIFTQPHTDVFTMLASQWLVSLPHTHTDTHTGSPLICLQRWMLTLYRVPPSSSLPSSTTRCQLHHFKCYKPCCHGDHANCIIHSLFSTGRTPHGLVVITLSPYWSIFVSVCVQWFFFFSFFFKFPHGVSDGVFVLSSRCCVYGGVHLGREASGNQITCSHRFY